MTFDRKTTAVIVIGFVLGYWSASSAASWSPHKDRPVVTWIAGAAKRLLWIAIVADPPPAEAETRHAEARVGEDGFRMVEHRRGW
jgi:succinyl-CoA synthetase alpha subunit